MFKKIVAVVVGLGASFGAFATAQDYSGVQTALTTEITGAMPTVLAVTGVVLAIGLGLRLIRRAAKG